MYHSVKKRKILLLKKISSNRLFSSFFSKTIAFTKFLRKKKEKSVRENFCNFQTLWIHHTVLSHFFDKNFVKVTFLLKKILKSRFDEIFFGWQTVNFSFFHSVQFKYSVNLKQKYNFSWICIFMKKVRRIHEKSIIFVTNCKRFGNLTKKKMCDYDFVVVVSWFHEKIMVFETHNWNCFDLKEKKIYF